MTSTKTFVRHAKFLQGKSKIHNVSIEGDDLWAVTSGASGNVYMVTRVEDHFLCTCDWHTYHPESECSHTIAVRKLLAALDGRTVSVWSTAEDARRQHHTLAGENGGVIFTSRTS